LGIEGKLAADDTQFFVHKGDRIMSYFDSMLERLGLRRIERRRYTLNGPLVDYVVALAEHEHRSPEEVAAELVASGAAQRDQASDSYSRWLTLSQREKEVAALVCLGLTNRQIAARLIISPETAKSHIKRVLSKFDLHSKDELRILMADWDFNAWK
jgi:DNA-binding CsgD family transcriptional regulator